jgi:hypothetical protein
MIWCIVSERNIYMAEVIYDIIVVTFERKQMIYQQDKSL